MGKALALISAVVLSACSHQIYLQPREGGPTGTGSASDAGVQSGKITVQVGERTYAGRWVSASGGSIGLMQAYGSNNQGGTVQAVGFSQNYSTSSTGTALMSAGDGSTMRCEFVYGGSAGYGVCQTNDGKLYDMQIN